ncbi:MAG: hypothetical protein IJ193_08520 [Bacilli bacterium]|nr:hypothetical protein [Bacilli bacterium]
MDYLDKLMSDTIIEKQLDGIKEGDFEIIPCNVGVVVKPYDENPYRRIEKTESGLIIGVQSSQKYKSDDSGEIEENDEYVTCAKVIAVGPFCRNVKVGEDVFLIKHILKPIPFRKQGLYEVDEQNILCRIVPKGTQNE